MSQLARAAALMAVAALSLSSHTSTAQNVDEAKVKQMICDASKDVESISADIVMTKTSQMLKEPTTTKGHIVYKRPDCISWVGTSDSKPFTLLANGQKAKITKEGKTKELNLADSRIYRRVKSMIKDGVGFETLIGSESFSVAISETGSQWVVTLTPERKEFKKSIKTVTLYADKADNIVKRVEMINKNDEKTTIELVNIKTNEKVDATLFNF